MSKRSDKPPTDFICPFYKMALLIRGPMTIKGRSEIACDGEKCFVFNHFTKRCGMSE